MSEQTPEQEQQYRIVVPEKTVYNFFKLTFPDGPVIVILLIVSVTIGAIGGWLFLMLALAASVAIVYGLEFGRTYYIVLQAFVSLRIRRRGGYLWRRSKRRSGAQAARSKRRARSPAKVIPLEVLALGRIGVIHDHYTGLDSIIVDTEGGEVASGDFNEQYQFVTGLADGVKRVATEVEGYSIGVSYIFYRRPLNITWLRRMIGSNYHPDVVVPQVLVDQVPEAQWTRRDRQYVAHNTLLRESFEEAIKHCGHTVMAFMVTISRDGDLTNAVGGRSIAASDVNQLPVSRIAEAMIRELQKLGLHAPRVLDPQGIQGYLRRAWDVASVDTYDNGVERYELDMLEIEADQKRLPETMPSMPSFWPVDWIRVGKRDKRGRAVYLVTDSTAHAVYKVRRCPPQSGAPNFFGQLHSIPVPWLTVTFSSDVVTSRLEYAVLGKAISIRDTTRDVIGYQREDPKARRRRKSLEKRQEDILESAFNQDGIALVVVSAPVGKGDRPFAELERHLDTARSVMEPLGMKPKLISGESRLLGAVLTGTSGVPVM